MMKLITSLHTAVDTRIVQVAHELGLRDKDDPTHPLAGSVRWTDKIGRVEMGAALSEPMENFEGALTTAEALFGIEVLELIGEVGRLGPEVFDAVYEWKTTEEHLDELLDMRRRLDEARDGFVTEISPYIFSERLEGLGRWERFLRNSKRRQKEREAERDPLLRTGHPLSEHRPLE